VVTDPTQAELTQPYVLTDAWGRTRRFKTSPLERLNRKLRPAPNGCLEFQGWLNNKGYGQIGIRGRRLMYTHRLAWIAAYGEIPAGMYVCHRCDNPACCNPEHLFLGTAQDNTSDMLGKGRHRVLIGEQNPRTKLTASDCADIRAARAAGESNRSIAQRYGMPKSHGWIGEIARGRVRAEL
jgi:hypothetical protein